MNKQPQRTAGYYLREGLGILQNCIAMPFVIVASIAIWLAAVIAYGGLYRMSSNTLEFLANWEDADEVRVHFVYYDDTADEEPPRGPLGVTG